MYPDLQLQKFYPIYAASPRQKAMLLVKMICQTRTALSLGNLELSASNLKTVGSQRMVQLLKVQTQAQMRSLLQRLRSKKPFCAEDQHWIERFALQPVQ